MGPVRLRSSCGAGVRDSTGASFLFNFHFRALNSSGGNGSLCCSMQEGCLVIPVAIKRAICTVTSQLKIGARPGRIYIQARLPDAHIRRYLHGPARQAGLPQCRFKVTAPADLATPIRRSARTAAEGRHSLFRWQENTVFEGNSRRRNPHHRYVSCSSLPAGWTSGHERYRPPGSLCCDSFGIGRSPWGAGEKLVRQLWRRTGLDFPLKPMISMRWVRCRFVSIAKSLRDLAGFESFKLTVCSSFIVGCFDNIYYRVGSRLNTYVETRN